MQCFHDTIKIYWPDKRELHNVKENIIRKGHHWIGNVYTASKFNSAKNIWKKNRQKSIQTAGGQL